MNKDRFEKISLGDKAPFFDFDTMAPWCKDVIPQINLLDDGLFVIALQSCWSEDEIGDFNKTALTLSFTYINDIIDIVYKFSGVIGDLAFTIHLANPATSSQLAADNITFLICLVDGNGRLAAMRLVAMPDDKTAILAQYFERQKKAPFDKDGFFDAIDKIYSGLSINDILEHSFVSNVFEEK